MASPNMMKKYLFLAKLRMGKGYCIYHTPPWLWVSRVLAKKTTLLG